MSLFHCFEIVDIHLFKSFVSIIKKESQGDDYLPLFHHNLGCSLQNVLATRVKIKELSLKSQMLNNQSPEHSHLCAEKYASKIQINNLLPLGLFHSHQ
jgi:hypothetical protein